MKRVQRSDADRWSNIGVQKSAEWHDLEGFLNAEFFLVQKNKNKKSEVLVQSERKEKLKIKNEEREKLKIK